MSRLANDLGDNAVCVTVVRPIEHKDPGRGRVLEESLELWAAIYVFVAALTWQRLWKNSIVQRSD